MYIWSDVFSSFSLFNSIRNFLCFSSSKHILYFYLPPTSTISPLLFSALAHFSLWYNPLENPFFVFQSLSLFLHLSISLTLLSLSVHIFLMVSLYLSLSFPFSHYLFISVNPFPPRLNSRLMKASCGFAQFFNKHSLRAVNFCRRIS